MNLQLQDCRICRGVIRIHRHGHELCCSAEQSDALQWGMEGQLVDNAIWADTVTRSTLHWVSYGHTGDMWPRDQCPLELQTKVREV